MRVLGFYLGVFCIGSLWAALPSVPVVNDTTRVRELFYKGREFTNTNPDSLLYYTLKSLSLANSIKDQKGQAMAYNSLGKYYWVKGDFERAISNYQEALSINKDIDNTQGIAYNLTNLSMVFLLLGDFPVSIDYSLQGLSLAESLHDDILIASIYNNLSVAHKNSKNILEAIRYNQLSLDLSETMSDQNNLAAGYLNKGDLFVMKSDLDEAEVYLVKALALFTEMGNTRGKIVSLNSLSSVHRNLGQFDLAEAELMEALKLSRQTGYVMNEIESMLGLADLYLIQKKYRKAIEFSQGAYELSKALGFKAKLIEAYSGLAKAYFGDGSYKRSAEFFQLYSSLKDSVFSENLDQSIANMRIAYEVRRNEREMEIVKRDHRIELLNRNIFILFSVGSFVILLLCGIIIYIRQLRKKEMLEKKIKIRETEFGLAQMKLQNQQLIEMELKSELTHRNNELTSYTLNMLQKNEAIKTIRDEMKAILVNIPSNLREKAQSIFSHANVSFHQDKEWEVFRTYFEGAHGGFLERLNQTVPGLSAADRKMAALIKLDMNLEQISSIMGISVDSVKVAKYRLRKKLGLGPAEDFQPMFSKIESSGRLIFSQPEDRAYVFHCFESSILNSNSFEEAAWEVAKNCIYHLKLEDCVIYFLDQERNVLVQKAAYGPKNPFGFDILSPIEIPVGTGITGYVALTGQPMLIPDTSKEPRYLLDDRNRLSELAVPVIAGDKVIGVIDSEHSSLNYFTKNHLEIFTHIAKVLATRIEHLEFA
jgi:tetratricopeptide (TPR) repeat protein/putative methionine-R-sulfoxide reductase with GAF domain/DNA-binding CsgD family transcriptional regulator